MIQFFPTDQGASKSHETLMDICSTFVASSKAAILVQPAQRTFHHPTDRTQPTTMFGTARCYQRLDAAVSQPNLVPVGIVGSIGRQFRRSPSGMSNLATNRRDTLHQGNQLSYVVVVCSGQDRTERNTVRVGDYVVLGAPLASVRWVRPSFFAPPTARTEALSTTARDQSSWSADRSRARRTRCSSSQTPAFCQSRSRRQQVIPLPQPISWGKYSQGIPVFRTKRMPTRVARSGTGGRPPLSRGGLLGIKGSITCQRSSVTNGGAIAGSSLTRYPLARWLNHPLSLQPRQGFVRRSKAGSARPLAPTTTRSSVRRTSMC